MKKTVAVLGLGIFGSSVAKKLNEFDCDVIAVDMSIDNVERVSDFVDQAIQADFTHYESLEEIGLGVCDIAVIGTSRNLESAILGVLNCKKLGIQTVIAKAKNKTYMDILYRIGADRVIRPEKDTGMRLAQELAAPTILDQINLDDRYNIYELMVPECWIGKSLIELDLRNKYGINLIGFKSATGEFKVQYDVQTEFKEGDIVVFIGDKDSLRMLL